MMMKVQPNGHAARMREEFRFYAPHYVDVLVKEMRNLSPRRLSREELSEARKNFSRYFGYDSPNEFSAPAKKAFQKGEFYAHDFGTGTANPDELTYGYLHRNPDGTQGGFVGIFSNVAEGCHISKDSVIIGSSMISGSTTKVISSQIVDSKIVSSQVAESYVRYSSIENASGYELDAPSVAKSGLLHAKINDGAIVYFCAIVPHVPADGTPFYYPHLDYPEIMRHSTLSNSEIEGGLVENSTVIFSRISGNSYALLSHIEFSRLEGVLSERSAIFGSVLNNGQYLDESVCSDIGAKFKDGKARYEWANEFIYNYGKK